MLTLCAVNKNPAEEENFFAGSGGEKYKKNMKKSLGTKIETRIVSHAVKYSPLQPKLIFQNISVNKNDNNLVREETFMI